MQTGQGEVAPAGLLSEAGGGHLQHQHRQVGGEDGDTQRLRATPGAGHEQGGQHEHGGYDGQHAHVPAPANPPVEEASAPPAEARAALGDRRHDALRAGASGFLLKDTPPHDLIQAVRVVAAGEAMLSPGVTRRLIGHFAAADTDSRRTEALARLESLTEREREVLIAVGQGLSNGEIGRLLYMSEATAKAHVSRMLTKLHAHNRVQIAVLAHDAGLR